MEEGYLALRWNNHKTIFTKILTLLREQEAYVDVSLACAGRLYPAHKFVLSTCSDYFKAMFSKSPCKHPIVFMNDVSTRDMEALLDFMYKGEVHVPQSELGSLLRTAEGLQVKGLAVPDDSPRTSAVAAAAAAAAAVAAATATPTVPSHATPAAHAAPSVPHSNPPTLLAPQRKRKRPPESGGGRKEEPPRLTLRPDLAPPPLNRSRPPRTNSRPPSGMPELKRIKKEDTVGGRGEGGGGGSMEPGEVPRTSPSPSQSSHNSEEPQVNHTGKIKEEDEEEPGAGEGGSGEEDPEEEEDDEEDEDDDEDEEEEEEEEEDGEASRGALSDVDACEQSNSSLPNSEMSTTELLQVDLSEDGTQFIIGPGGYGEVVSRGSSLAGEEERSAGDGEHKKPFVCPLCGQSFTRRDNLANHIKTHTGDRPFMCKYCHKCFSRKDYLKQHERIHTGEKPYACSVCGRAFTRKEGLTDHMRCHSDFKAFSCETCGKSFKQKCGLRFHKRNYKH